MGLFSPLYDLGVFDRCLLPDLPSTSPRRYYGKKEEKPVSRLLYYAVQPVYVFRCVSYYGVKCHSSAWMGVLTSLAIANNGRHSRSILYLVTSSTDLCKGPTESSTTG